VLTQNKWKKWMKMIFFSRSRRWSTLQGREFGALHAAISYLVLSCDTEPKRSHKTDTRPNPAIDYTPFEEPACRVFPKSALNNRYVEMPTVVTNLLYENKGMTWLFIREAVSACREISGTCEFGAKIIVDMLVQVSYCSLSFSQLLMDELMKQYNQVNSGELKNLSSLMLEILVMEDPLHIPRLDYIIDECEIEVENKSKDGDDIKTEKVKGLLALIKSCHVSNSRRSYHCIKSLIAAANKSKVVEEKLLRDPEKWQWAVNWLKENELWHHEQ